MPTDWNIVEHGRHARLRQRVAAPDPASLAWLSPEQRDILARWLPSDATTRRRDSLMRLAGAHRLESAETLASWLLEHGWVRWHERWQRGRWSWEAISWRDLDTLRAGLGVQGHQQRRDARHAIVQTLADWAERLPADGAATEAIVVMLRRAVHVLRDEAAQTPLPTLQSRAHCVQTLWMWGQQRRTGTRRDFALQVTGSTKGLSPADWQWLARHFDLEAWGVSAFAPVLWLAGQARLCWPNGHGVDLAALHLVAVPMDDVRAAGSLQPPPQRWWLIENRASFERQAGQRGGDTLLVWMPGRTSQAWQDTLLHLVRQAPAPLAISCDLDPAGLEMALALGQCWQALGQPWAPWRMDAQHLDAADTQPLGDDDRQRLARLLARDDLPAALRALALHMQHTGRKAEQEAWL